MIAVRHTLGKGRGVFAERPIAPGELIERAPVLVVAAEDVQAIDETMLIHYAYAWGPKRKGSAIGLGYSSLYNHSFHPNARYIKRLVEQELDFVALCPIAAGQEITINYNGDPADQSPVHFEVVDE